MPVASPLVVPQVNVNDDSVVLVRWAVEPDAVVTTGDHVCDVETTKAVSEVVAHASGVLLQHAVAGSRVNVGDTLGVIAATREEAAAYLADRAVASGRASGGVTATPKARALAEQLGVSLDAIAAAGVVGAIKESDVRRFHAQPAVTPATAAVLPAALAPFLEEAGRISEFDATVASSLRRSTSSLILTSVDMECRLTEAHRLMRDAAASGRMISVLHLIIAAAARALPQFERLAMLAHGGMLYRYRAADVAFVVRANDGRLFTPVIRGADALPVDAIATQAQALTMSILRNRIRAEELQGAAFTISQVSVPGTTRVVALPSFGQSAILGVSAERTTVVMDGAGGVQAVPTVTLTLNYDHALCDGMYAAGFLAEVVKHLEAPAQ